MRDIRRKIISDKDLLYFDYTASGQAYAPIEREVRELLKTYANTHSEVSSSAVSTSRRYEKARADLREALEINDDFYLLPVGTGATAAIKRFQELMGIYIPPATRNRYAIAPKDTPLILVGPYEHHSNEISFREGLCEVIRIPINDKYCIDLTALAEELEKHRDREIIASFSVASNVTGVLSDYKKIYEMVKNYGGILCLDAATASPYMNIDCRYYDALFLSPHKLLGGVGSCGLLLIKKELCINIKPTFAGGGTVSYVSRKDHKFLDDFELKEDAGTPGIIQLIRASLAYNLRNEIGLDVIHKKEKYLKKYFGSKVKEIDGLKLHCGFEQEKLPIFSINFKGIDPFDIAEYLSDHYGIQARAGCSCAGPYGHDLLGLEDAEVYDSKVGWLRISIHFTHTTQEIDILIAAIQEATSTLAALS
ncbi:MAG: aminotransferase class V-fold PLP-dependent enzyme [Sulfurovum sp.]|nr:aminotransferase class V-fold PLP-dependent enzyme [Sulfurovum sp.]